MMWEREPSHTIGRNKRYNHYGKKQLPQKVKYGAAVQPSYPTTGHASKHAISRYVQEVPVLPCLLQHY